MDPHIGLNRGTVKIAGCWDKLMLPSAAVEYNSRWKFLGLGFDLDGIYMAPVMGNKHVIEVDDIMDAVQANPNLVPVLVDECSPNQLQSFEHPQDVLYIFGRTGMSFFGGWEGVSVSIEHPHKLTSYLQPDQAAAIVLYDRMIKSWR